MVRVLHNDALVLGEKLGDATERRAEIQATNDLIARELDVLTEKLFEEANHLVSAESRRRYVQPARPRSPAVDVAAHTHAHKGKHTYRHEAEVAKQRAEERLAHAQVLLQTQTDLVRELRTKLESGAAPYG